LDNKHSDSHGARAPGAPAGAQREDTDPWYRQFWPWFLIALPGSVVIAGFVTLYIANRYSDDLVVQNYYKDGLAINQQLEKQARARDLGVGASLLLLGDRVQVRLQSPANSDGEPATLNLLLSHPLESDRDFAVDVERVAPTLYVGAMPDAAGPNWHWTLEPAEGGWRLDGSLGPEAFLDSDAPGR